MKRTYLVTLTALLVITAFISFGYKFSFFSLHAHSSKIKSVGCGYWHSLIVKSDGSVLACGANWYGQLGNGTRTDSSVPVKVSALENVKSVACGSNHSIAVKEDGTVWSWGNNYSGQLGDGTNATRIIPVKVLELDEVQTVSCGDNFSLALKKDGTVWAWGDNSYGQLGNGTKASSTKPVQVLALEEIKSIACGSYYCAVVKTDGTVWTWGNNSNGQLGDGTLVSQIAPSRVLNLESVDSIACGNSHTIALKRDGTVFSWGSNGNGQLGIHSMKTYTEPIQITDLVNIQAIACGYSHSLAINKDGSVLSWGGCTFLGDGKTCARNKPVELNRIHNAAQIFASNDYSIAVTEDGEVMSWGKNWKGQLGNSTITDCKEPSAYLIEVTDQNKYISDIKSVNDENVSSTIQTPKMNLKKNSFVIKVISNKQWGLNNNGQSVSNKKGVVGVDINVVPAWRITKNVNPCIVGIIDSGIDIKHSALKKNVYTNLNEIPGNGIDDDNNGYIDDINGWDFFNNDSSVFDSSEKDSHGTSVAGIIVANDKNAKIFGVVPNAKILPLKITEDSVNVNITNVIKAIEYAQSLGVTTINCSFGTSEKSFALQNIIEITDSIFVCAAGNSGKDIAVDPIYPACFNADNIISVAAVDNTGSLDNWSNYGKKIQVAAPGSDIITTIPENKYGLFSGTSMAAPFVTGAATLIKMNDFKITNKEVVLTICKNVTFIKKLRGKVSSSGIVNVYKSLKFKSKR